MGHRRTRALVIEGDPSAPRSNSTSPSDKLPFATEIGPGRHHITVCSPGFAPRDEDIEVPATPEHRIVIQLGVLRTGDEVIGEGDSERTETTKLRLGPTLAYAGVGAAVAVVGAILWISSGRSNSQVGVGASSLTYRRSF